MFDFELIVGSFEVTYGVDCGITFIATLSPKVFLRKLSNLPKNTRLIETINLRKRYWEATGSDKEKLADAYNKVRLPVEYLK